jgi:hypothetical protein
VKLPFLPLHFWNDDTLKAIGNSLGRYIDQAEPKYEIQDYERICVEVDMEKGLLVTISLNLDD